MSDSMAYEVNKFVDAVQPENVTNDEKFERFGEERVSDNQDKNSRKSRVVFSVAESNVAVNINISIGDLIEENEAFNEADVVNARKKSSMVKPGKLKHWQRRSVFVNDRRDTLEVSFLTSDYLPGVGQIDL